MKNIIYLVLFMFTLSGCIEPYNAKTDSIDSILVVEGIISSGTTRITLSKSVGLDENLWRHWGGEDQFAVNHAIVYVECEDGTRSNPTYSSGGGNYLIETGELNVDKRYRLVINLDGEKYQSSFLAPAISPPIDTILFKVDRNDLINVYVSTTGFEHQPGYYLWSYKEDWEITSITEGPWVIIQGETVDNDLFSPNNRFYCWRKDSSRNLILGSTEKLIENSIREKSIHSFNRTSERTSELYRIIVFQNTIHKEAYDYFYNLEKNIKQIGSIFGPIPSEIMGNIKCESNPNIPVIGYVDVSTTSSKEGYLDSRYYDYTFKVEQAVQCSLNLDTISTHEERPPVPRNGFVKYKYIPGPPLGLPKDTVYIAEYCVDCTKNGGSKRKPKNWPNDHQ